MKKFTKSLLTLMLLAGGAMNASAQEEWTSLINNGDFEGDGNSNFYVKQQEVGNAVQVAQIVDGIGKDGSKGIRIQAKKGATQDWDTQFWIVFDKKVPSGTNVKISFDYRAATDESVSTQLHALPGDYLWWNGPFSLSFTNGWNRVSNTYTLSKGEDDKILEVQSIAFNMACGKQYNDFYLDNFVVEVESAVYAELDDRDAFAEEPGEQTMLDVQEISEDDEPLYDKAIPEGFENLIVNGDLEGDGLDNFRVNDYVGGEKQEVAEPRVIADPANGENKCIIVGTNANPTYEWDAQFFVTVPEEQHFNVGDVIRLKMRVKADASQSAGSQSHADPGSYIIYYSVGDIAFKKMWTNFDSGDIEVTEAMMKSDTNPGPFRTIAFNLSKITEGNNVYFDEIQLLVKRPDDPLKAEKDALAAAITIGKAQSDFGKTSDTFAALTSALETAEAIEVESADKEKLVDAANAINLAIDGFVCADGYTKLTADMFKAWDDNILPTEGTNTGCDYNLNNSVGSGDIVYGNGSVYYKNFADISEFNNLIVLASGAPRIMMNRIEDEGDLEQLISESIDGKYTVEAGKYTVNLTAYPYVHLNAIKVPFGSDPIIITDALLYRFISFGEAGWASFGSNYKSAKIDAKVYAVKFNSETGKMDLTEVEDGIVPAGVGVIVAGTTEVEPQFGAEVVGTVESDLLISNGTVAGDGESIYVLAKKGEVVGFYLLTKDEVIPAGKAYYKAPAGDGARTFIALGGDVTGIKTVESAKAANNAIYNLAGQRLVKAQKGLNIVNGKKIMK